jgi:hypothetical protein
MSIQDDYKLYTDQFGLVHSSKGDISQNGLRFTTEYLFALKRCQEPIDSLIPSYNACITAPGLICRHPSNPDEQEGPDDTFAILAASKELKTTFAKDWLQYGRTSLIMGYDELYDRKKWWHKLLFSVLSTFEILKFVFNTPRPGMFNVSAWMGRQLPLVAHAKVCAGERLSFVEQLIWCMGVLFSAYDAKSQDGKSLTWFAVKASKGSRSWIMSWACRVWSRKLKEQWGEGGMGAVLKAYFGDKEQPSIKWLWGDLGD